MGGRVRSDISDSEIDRLMQEALENDGILHVHCQDDPILDGVTNIDWEGGLREVGLEKAPVGKWQRFKAWISGFFSNRM